ncbi:MAG: alpha-amylase [Lachnospiraceae bacterium]|nr:alpha-amylase [Lachnospiraceae bacterium]
MGKKYEIIDSIYGAFPVGVHIYGEYVHFAVEAPGDKGLVLCLYDKSSDDNTPVERLAFPKENRLGDIRYIDVKGIDLDKEEYSFELSDGTFIRDEYAKQVSGWNSWGDVRRLEQRERYGFAGDSFDWEDDLRPQTALNETIIYRLHVRGFTKHASSGVKHKGEFLGIAEKIPYFKELGVTTVELMIPVEFNEVRRMDYNISPFVENDININYWGYGKAYYFAPKAAYSSENPAAEFKMLVKSMHKAGLEVIIELNFDYEAKASYVIDCLRYWAEYYHVDGFKLGGNVPYRAVSEDAALRSLKLFAASWEGCIRRRNLISCNEGYMNDMRRFIKGDENTLTGYLHRMTENPVNGAVVNYFADNNTLTMMDMVSYDVKHNEANGEGNRDGQDYNFSWNCGFEGQTRKKKIIDLRRKLLGNAYIMLFLSQGIPMLRAGDEMGQSKSGNNNAYCQDNKTSWINWKQLSTNKDIYECVKRLIEFRKGHDLFRKKDALREADYNSFGLPEFSIHGVDPWYPQFEHFRRQLGLLYFGEYSAGENVESCYIIANMHWESHDFVIPKVPGVRKWKVIADTSKAFDNIFSEKLFEGQSYHMQPRSMAVLQTVRNTHCEDEEVITDKNAQEKKDDR